MASLPLDQIKRLGAIMGIWAHPDDETLMMGGLMAAARQQGQRVVCITATRGEEGVQDPGKWSASTMGKTRAQELAAALRILDVKNHQWLDYRDGDCHNVSTEEAVSRLGAFIDQYRPDTIITFAPDGLTGHQDHQAVSSWATTAATKSTRPIKVYYAVATQDMYASHWRALDEKINIFFNIDQPHLYPTAGCDLVVELPPDLAAKKGQALASMPSQYETMFKLFPMAFIRDAFAVEAFVDAAKTRSAAL